MSHPKDAHDDPTAWVRRLSETYGRIKFGRGVVGKTGHAVIALFIIWGLIIWKMNGTPLDLIFLLPGFIATGVFVWWTRSTQQFAQKNPAQAMLEGAEFLEFHKFEAQAKGGLVGSRTLTVNPNAPPATLPLDESPDR